MTQRRVAHALSLVRVTKRFGPVVAVDDVSLAVGAGEFLTLLGPSGSGKTTLLMIIAGFMAPNSGDILVDDAPITRRAPEKRNFGMVFQGYALFPHMTVAENIAFPLKVRRAPRADIEARVRAMLDLVQLGGLADRLPRQLSGGQQQRVALARALAFSPDLVLLDEPLSALDKKLRAELQHELKELHRRIGATFISVTHDQEEALSMSDRVAVLRDGRKMQEGSPEEVYNYPRSRFVAEFLGFANYFEGTLAEDGADRMMVRLNEHVCVTLPPYAPRRAPMSLVIRSERIGIAERFTPCRDATVLDGTVAAVDYLGFLARYFVECSGLRFQIVSPADGAPFRQGHRVQLQLRAADWLICAE